MSTAQWVAKWAGIVVIGSLAVLLSTFLAIPLLAGTSFAGDLLEAVLKLAAMTSTAGLVVYLLARIVQEASPKQKEGRDSEGTSAQ